MYCNNFYCSHLPKIYQAFLMSATLSEVCVLHWKKLILIKLLSYTDSTFMNCCKQQKLVMNLRTQENSESALERSETCDLSHSNLML